jgi:hypothetical protein
MNIEEAKSDLEKKIIHWDGVIGIGVINENNNSVIEITIDKKDETVSKKINQLITQNCWKGYNVIVVPANGFKFQ